MWTCLRCLYVKLQLRDMFVISCFEMYWCELCMLSLVGACGNEI